MEKPIISGIQQIGIGVPQVYEAWNWYRKHFGIDIKILDEEGKAEHMLPYTGGKPRRRHAVLAINLQGGGGFEIWQYKCREPQPPDFTPQFGDVGILAARIKCRDVTLSYRRFRQEGIPTPGGLQHDPAGNPFFFAQDPFGNLFQLVNGKEWFYLNGHPTGGVFGATLGVSDLEKACHFYRHVLGYDEVVYHRQGRFEDLQALPGGKGTFRRALLRHTQPREGCFSRLLGPSELELVQCLDRRPRKIFQNRFWGDLGFIHLSFDIRGMDAMRRLCAEKGFPFTVDSRDSFDMGEAAGHFSYVEDPDGNLIEFVETHKVPVLKKFNLYLDLRKRNPRKPLPYWMVRALAFNRVKD